MKKTLMFILVLVAAVSVATPAFAQDDESILIYPWRIPLDENGERIITVSHNQEIRLGARWGACTKGLAQAWSKTADVEYVIDETPILVTRQASQYWSRPTPVASPSDPWCMNNTDTVWYVYWEYQLGILDVGDHPVHFEYWNERLQIDGGDYDGDGKPDKFNDWGWDLDFIIRVVE